MRLPIFPQTEAVEFVVDHMEHFGSIYGIAKAADGYRELIDIPWDMNAKGVIAQKVITACLERSKVEAWAKIKLQIEKNGVGVLQSILENSSGVAGLLNLE